VRARLWILIVPILAAGCAGGSGDRATESGAQKQNRASARVEREQARDSAGQPEGGRVVAGKPDKSAKPAKASAAATRRARLARTRPWRQKRVLPWRRTGVSQVVHVRVRKIAVYSSPIARRPMLRLAKRDERGTQRAFLVRSRWQNWIKVSLPTRPNGSTGWVRRRAVELYKNRYRLVVRLKKHELQLWKERKLMASYPVAVGTRWTPTPRGMFYVVELLKPRSPHGAYGPYSFGLSAHSNVLKRFAGGDGRVGLHGTNQPWLIGSDVSHGCIRLKNPAIRRLAKILPLATPVLVRT
jgi:lipoprotein-anchoring transpeptidase ErfK/SrfK